MVDRQQTVGRGINVCLCGLSLQVKLVVSSLIFLQMETDRFCVRGVLIRNGVLITERP